MGNKPLSLRLLDNWSGKRAEATVSIRKHSRLVVRMKTLLVVAVLFLMALLAVWPMFNPAQKNMKLTFSTVSSNELGMPQMLKPEYQGVDDQNQPYRVLADIAVQENKDTVRLSKVSGNIAMKNGENIKLAAKGGIITLDTEILKLYDGVQVVSSEGYRLETESASAKLKEKRVEGVMPVNVEGPMGQLFAQGFLLDSNKATLRFYGPVKMIINPGQL